MKRLIHHSYNNGQYQIDMYKIDINADFSLLYKWMHEPHVAEFWQLNLPKDKLLKHFENALIDTHQELFIIAIDKQLIAYGETYEASKDKLANFCKVQDNDFGIHLLIGEKSALGKNYSSLIVCALTDYLFQKYSASLVLVEPSSKVKQLTILERKLGFSNLGNITLPEKIATLYAINSKTFYNKNPKPITCDLDHWPIVNLHFPSYPTDDAVKNWIQKIDKVIDKKDPYIVISTFEENYQFSQNARKEEIFWFKRNKPILQKYCLGMLRVTTDTEMIRKLNNPALNKGMPFPCIACNTWNIAYDMALKILKNHNIIIKELV